MLSGPPLGHRRSVADLVLINGARKVEKGIPFDAVQIAMNNVD
jgi:hypothetical protein